MTITSEKFNKIILKIDQMVNLFLGLKIIAQFVMKRSILLKHNQQLLFHFGL
jgi:hypothetical protein